MILARVLTSFCAALALTAATSGASHAASRADVKEIVIEEALATTVPPSLALAVAKVESDFQARALSPEGARGVMQIMPATAKGEFGVAADELWDARLNVRLGIEFLARLVERYDGRWDLALSHYNSGRVMGTGARATPLPATRKYVDSVMRWQRRYADQARGWRAAPAWRPARRPAKTRVVRRTGSVWSRRLGERPRRPVPAVSAPAGRYRPGESFKDCKECPEMVAVPPGSFVMGSPAGEKGRGDSEGPRRRVVLAGALAVGKYEVTFAEWDACRADGGCDGHLPDDRGWGRGSRPVIGVSWRAAAAYVAWLGRSTGKPYRLLSEAEWEYAARAGIAAPSAWGRHLDGACMFANVHDLAGERSELSHDRPYPCDDGHAWTAPVGSYHVNQFGLHDMLGNVAEWVSDCWWPDHRGAPLNGAARGGDRCRRHVVRGGSWRGQVGAVRAAARRSGAVDNRDETVGFRVVRALDDEYGGLLPGRSGRARVSTRRPVIARRGGNGSRAATIIGSGG